MVRCHEMCLEARSSVQRAMFRGTAKEPKILDMWIQRSWRRDRVILIGDGPTAMKISYVKFSDCNVKESSERAKFPSKNQHPCEVDDSVIA
jgi:hypothetical protein